MTVGILHPGAMGAAVAACLPAPAMWASDGRSSATYDRAAALADVGTVGEVARRSDVIVSLCPPEFAEGVAADVAHAGFDGIYVDANAVAPATVRRIAAGFERFVDGGVIGPPPLEPGTTRLYLSGVDAPHVAALFDRSALEAIVLSGDVGAASALKMAYAGWTKGSAALLLAVRALAESEGVTIDLLDEWDRSQPGLSERSERTASGTAPKAWRFSGEMHEIALAMAAHDLPAGFHSAAAEIYDRLAELRDLPGVTLDQVLEQISSTGPGTGATTVDRSPPPR